ncbi:MAG: carboxypeptidase-like regulatory domain-containing protein [Flavobacteriaceae bacterium]
MKKAIRISIPEPCHEDWAKMTPTEKGKFCSVCTKEVFDFTQTADEDLVKRVTQGKNLCGRFKKSQLDRELTLERKSGNSLLPYAASLLMPLSVLATSEVKNNAIEKPYISLGIGSNPVKSIIQVSGYVTDEAGQAVENAKIQILNSDISALTNKEGFFSLKCASGSKLVVNKGALRSKTITLGSKNENVTISLFAVEVQNNLILGRIAPEEIKEEVMQITSGDIEVIETPKSDIIKVLESNVSTCKFEKPTEHIEKQEDSTNIFIKGTVTDENNLVLPGVNILVKGTTNGTQTDFDGNYSIELEPNQTLQFSYLGYKTKEIAISNINNEISFSMELDGTLLNEIVVVGGAVSVSSFYYQNISTSSIEERKEYNDKVKAYNKVKAERKKAARLLKRNQKRK